MNANNNTLLNGYQKIGAQVYGMSTSEALESAQMTGWNQRLVEPMIYDGTDLITSDHRFNIGDVPLGPDGEKKKTVLGGVLKTYKVMQNEEVLTPLIDSFRQGGMNIDTVGSFDDGKAVFAAFRLPEVNLAGENIGGYIVCTKRNDGGGAARATAVKYRIWCANQLTGIAKRTRPVVSVRHTRNADPMVMQQAEVLLGLTSEWDRELAREIERLQKVTVSKERYIKEIVPAVLAMPRPEERGRSQTIFDRKFDELVAAWSSPVHAEGNTGFRAYSAITEWEQHHRSTNQRLLAEAAINERQPATARALAVLVG